MSSRRISFCARGGSGYYLLPCTRSIRSKLRGTIIVQIKIGDFGISNILSSTYACAHSKVGTPHYLSPELCRGKGYAALPAFPKRGAHTRHFAAKPPCALKPGRPKLSADMSQLLQQQKHSDSSLLALQL